MKLFPFVTYDLIEFLEIKDDEMKNQEFLNECKKKRGWYLHVNGGRIWLREHSIITLIHEYLHFIGFSLNLPRIWHKLIEIIL